MAETIVSWSSWMDPGLGWARWISVVEECLLCNICQLMLPWVIVGACKYSLPDMVEMLLIFLFIYRYVAVGLDWTLIIESPVFPPVIFFQVTSAYWINSTHTLVSKPSISVEYAHGKFVTYFKIHPSLVRLFPWFLYVFKNIVSPPKQVLSTVTAPC